MAGFSQGGAVALLLLRSQLKLAGVAGLSTWLTLPQEELLSAQNKDTPLWMAHGTADQVVSALQASLTLPDTSADGSGAFASPACSLPARQVAARMRTVPTCSCRSGTSTVRPATRS